MFAKKTIRDIDLDQKTVLLRADYNVPVAAGQVTDDYRIIKSLPTVNYLLERGCGVVVISHLGRPEGPDDKSCSLKPVGAKLGELLGRQVDFIDDCIGDVAQETKANLSSGQVLLLENLRYYPEEEANDANFAAKLAKNCDIFVQDGFGVVHRAHASTEAVTHILPSVSGLLIEEEVTKLTSAIDNPAKPLLAITGGAKLETKLPLLENLMSLADNIAVAGVMANVLLAAQGKNIGKSVVDEGELSKAKEILENAQAAGINFVLPDLDVAVGKGLDDEHRREIELQSIGDEDMILDFGQKSIDRVADLVKEAKTIIWNGPLGYYENPQFSGGSEQVARAIAESDAISVVGGGDTAEIVNNLGLADKFTHVSTGGGSSLDLLSGKKLPGVEALLDRDG